MLPLVLPRERQADALRRERATERRVAAHLYPRSRQIDVTPSTKSPRDVRASAGTSHEEQAS